jgi:acetyl esterase
VPNGPKLDTPQAQADSPSVAAVRAAERAKSSEIPKDCVVADRSVASARGELRMRWYRPRDRSEAGTAHEAAGQGAGLVFFHGGGFVAGDVARHDAFCGQLSVASGCAVVSCSYRLAPEHRFPAALDDAYFAACFVHEHADEFEIDHRRLGIGGIEVGASLATGVARLAKERRNPALAFQLLIQPVFDFSPEGLSGVIPSHSAPLEWAVAHYTDARRREDPRCSPMRATNLIGLPSTFMLAAERTLAAEHVKRYADRLREAHVPVAVIQAAGAAADLLEVPDSSEQGRRAVTACAKALAEALNPG